MNYFDIPKINASTLKLFSGPEEDFSPFSSVYAMRNREDKPAYQMGHAAHEALQYQGKIQPKYVRSIYETFRSNKAKDWRDQQISEGKEVLSQKDYDAVTTMVDAVWNNCPVDVKEIIQNQSAKREAIYQTDEYKAMMDLVDDETIFDYKTTASKTPGQIQREAFNYGYHIQAYHYRMVKELVDGSAGEFFFIFVSKAAPHEVFLFRATPDFLQKGKEDWQVAMERHQKYKDMPLEDLPRFSDNPMDLELPPWAYSDSDEIVVEAV